MSELLAEPAFAPRDDATFVREMNALSRWHWEGCPEYRRVWPAWTESDAVETLPYLHVGVFKHRLFRTEHPEIEHQRVLHSSATSNVASKISLDAKSSALQTESAVKIFEQSLGPGQRPLLVLDSVKSLRQRGEVSARVAAAMSLKPLASEIQFLMGDPQDPASLNWEVVKKICAEHERMIVYGFTWILWTAWGGARMPDSVREALRGKHVHFVHSGGWKKLEHLRIDRAQFDAALLAGLGGDSSVLDFYGLVEQVGVTFPLCSAGFRHVPRWAEVLVRDPWTLGCLQGETGQLQLMNPLAYGAPYHNVLTEDLGRLVAGECPCGWSGRRFELLGRVPQAEVRGCAMSNTMPGQLHYFESDVRRVAVELPFDERALLDGWKQLRSFMIRDCPAAFTRDEWAYLIGFLGTDSLSQPFRQAFGKRVDAPSGPIDALFRPRGPVAVWLPGNVSMLGPLVMVLVSLTGNPARFKASSKAEDLSAVLLDFAISHLKAGPLVDYLANRVKLERFERDDPRNRALAAEAAVRIFFGSDAGAAAVEALPHPPASVGFSFIDHQSQSWIERPCATTENLSTLLRVFAIYGQAGCTSPRRLVVLDGTLDDCRRIRDELLALWPQVQKRDPPMHIASANIMARQLAATDGWDAQLAARQRGVVAVGEIGGPDTPNLMSLAVVGASPDEAVAHLPANIQTIGHALANPQDPKWLSLIVRTKVKRFVPIAQMHYFSPTWDGWSFWQQMFEEVVVVS